VVLLRRGRHETVTARKEVIVAASSINSPKLLMLSGIGPAEHLREHGIEVVSNRPGVGANLQDHLEVYVQQACTHPITLNAHLGLLPRARIGLQWLTRRTGLGATNHFESCAFIRSAPGVPYPDLQMHFLPAAVRYDGRSAATAHGFQVHVGPMRSPSRGSVRLKSGRPSDAPVIRFNYMSREEDWRDFRTAIRLTREIFAQPALSGYRGEEIAPGAPVRSDEELDDFVRENVESAYHPCGTCRMGAPDAVESVVDPQCRVIGTEVCASSIRRSSGNHQRQLERAIDPGRRKGRRHDPGPAAARGLKPRAVDAPELGGQPALSGGLHAGRTKILLSLVRAWSR
jgi:choline dehydrogenase